MIALSTDPYGLRSNKKSQIHRCWCLAISLCLVVCSSYISPCKKTATKIEISELSFVQVQCCTLMFIQLCVCSSAKDMVIENRDGFYINDLYCFERLPPCATHDQHRWCAQLFSIWVSNISTPFHYYAVICLTRICTRIHVICFVNCLFYSGFGSVIYTCWLIHHHDHNHCWRIHFCRSCALIPCLLAFLSTNMYFSFLIKWIVCHNLRAIYLNPNIQYVNRWRNATPQLAFGSILSLDSFGQYDWRPSFAFAHCVPPRAAMLPNERIDFCWN